MGSACSRAASAVDGFASQPRSSTVSPDRPLPRVAPRTPAVRAADGSLTPPPLLELCVQCVARHLGEMPTPLRLPPEIASRVVAHLVSRAWLDLGALRCLHDSPLLVLELPGLAQVDMAWTHVICAHTELVRLDLSGAPSLVDACVAPIGKLPSLRELNLSSCPCLSDAALQYVAALSTLRLLKLEALPRVSDVGVAQLERLPALRWLSLAGCAGLKTAAAASIARCACACPPAPRAAREQPVPTRALPNRALVLYRSQARRAAGAPLAAKVRRRR